MCSARFESAAKLGDLTNVSLILGDINLVENNFIELVNEIKKHVVSLTLNGINLSQSHFDYLCKEILCNEKLTEFNIKSSNEFNLDELATCLTYNTSLEELTIDIKNSNIKSLCKSLKLNDSLKKLIIHTDAIEFLVDMFTVNDGITTFTLFYSQLSEDLCKLIELLASNGKMSASFINI